MRLTEEELKSHIAKKEFMKMWEKTMICMLTLDNWFEVIWTSAPIDKESFDEWTWQNIAYDNAVDKLRELYWFLAQANKPV